MRFFQTLIALFVVFLCTAQPAISGLVTEQGTGNPLPFVNIGIDGAGIGTVSDQNGYFTLKLGNQTDPDATVNFSHVGYETRSLLVSDLVGKANTIALHPANDKLEEVIVKFTQPKKKKLGRTIKGLGLMHANFYTFSDQGVDDRLSREMGMKIKIRKNCQMQALNFNISQNDFKTVRFRVNFYSIKDNLPDTLLLDSDIVFTVDDGFMGWYKVDLSKYDVYIDKATEDIAVTIQWLESVKKTEQSKYFALTTAIAPTETFYYRDKAFDKWSGSGSSISFYLDAKCN